jgi:hypothetical protein
MPIFSDINDCEGGAKDVSGIKEGHEYILQDMECLVVINPMKIIKAFFRILNGVDGLKGRESLPRPFSVQKFNILFLDMRTIPQQGAGEVKGGGGAENKAIKALFSQIRDVSAMVNVGMGEDKGGDVCRLEGKIQVSFTALLAPSLEKTAIK